VAILSLKEAADAAGCSRQHIYRLVGKGRISAVLRDDGSKGIDTAELLRVFGNIRSPAANQVTGDSHPGDSRRQQVTAPATTAQVAVMEVELRAAKDALRVAEDRLREAQEREGRLLELLAAQTRMLEHSAPAQERPQTTPEKPPAPPDKSLGLRVSIPRFSDLKAR